MLPCHSCYIYGNWRSKEVGNSKSWYGEENGGTGSQTAKGWAVFMGEGVYPSASLYSVFWCKKSSMICIHNIHSCQNLISTRQLGKYKSLNQVSFLELLLHYLFFINLQMSTEWELAFLNTVIIIFSLIYSLNIPHSNQNPSFFPVEGSVSISSKFTFRRHFIIS